MSSQDIRADELTDIETDDLLQEIVDMHGGSVVMAHAMANEKKRVVKKLPPIPPEEREKFIAEAAARRARDRELVKLSLVSAARNGGSLVSSR